MTTDTFPPPRAFIELKQYISTQTVVMRFGGTHIRFKHLDGALHWISLWHPTVPIKYLWPDV